MIAMNNPKELDDACSAVSRINANLVQSQNKPDIADAFEVFLNTVQSMILLRNIPSQDKFILSAVDIYFRSVEEYPWVSVLAAVYRTWGANVSRSNIQSILYPLFVPDISLIHQLDDRESTIVLRDDDAGMGCHLMQCLRMAFEHSGSEVLSHIELFAISKHMVLARICAAQIMANCLVQRRFLKSLSVQYGAVKTVCTIPLVSYSFAEKEVSKC